MSKQIGSISEFLLHAQTQYHVFDMGRCIRPLDPQQFLAIEQASVPAPYPRQQHAWFGIIYWNKQASEQRYIWFLKLPLDEKGCVVDATRQQFLEIIVAALGGSAPDSDDNNVDISRTHQQTDNPYIFTPPQGQLAAFNALSRKEMGLPTCADHQQALDYLNAPAVQQWQNLSTQSLVDAVIFANDQELSTIIEQCLQQYPVAVNQTICSALENRNIQPQLAATLSNMTLSLCEENNPLSLYALRALSHMPDRAEQHALITAFLAHKNLDADGLQVIAGRHWQALNGALMSTFLERAAQISAADPNYRFFCALYADVVQIPDTRETALAVLRAPERSQQLSAAIGALFQQA